MEVPTFDELIGPSLVALHELWGSASIDEIVERVISNLKPPQDVIERPHGRGNRTELEYRLAWARTYLKKYGLIDNSERAVWSLTAEGNKRNSIDSREVVQFVKEQLRSSAKSRPGIPVSEAEQSEQFDEEGIETSLWQEDLIEILLEIPPDAFERLCQRILRESGFIEVEVTGRSGDGGIDGRGIIRIAGLISFNVFFQSKRHRGTLGPNVVRDFRGAMIGRADKGLLISTGSFTRDARKEATRDGAPPIDLIDGYLLADKLKELKLGVKTMVKEVVEVERDWFIGL